MIRFDKMKYKIYDSSVYDNLENLAASNTFEYIVPENPNLKYVFEKDSEFSSVHDDLYGGEYNDQNFIDTEVFYKNKKIGYTSSMDLDQLELDLEADNLGKNFFCKTDYTEEFETTIPKGILQVELENVFYEEGEDTTLVYLSEDVRYRIKYDTKEDSFTVSMETKQISGYDLKEDKHETDFLARLSPKTYDSIKAVVDYILEDKEFERELEHEESVKQKTKPTVPSRKVSVKKPKEYEM